MKAIILAAGVGQRLSSRHNEPKCLLQLGGKSLFERHLESLRACGIQEMVICVGYQAAKIEAEIQRLAAGQFCRTVYNDAFERGSSVSLWCMRHHLRDDDTLLMDADVLYNLSILERLTKTTRANCFLLDREFEAGDEPVKLCISNGRLVEFRKQLDPALDYDQCGESVGFFRLSPTMGARLALTLEDYYENQRYDEPYEEALRDILLQYPDEFSYEDVTGNPWIEIDFPEDVDRARDVILPRLKDG